MPKDNKPNQKKSPPMGSPKEGRQETQREKKKAAPSGDSIDKASDFGELLVESSPDALIALSPQGTVLFWNAGAEAVFGFSKEQAVGKDIYDLLVPSELIAEARQATQQAIEGSLVVYESLRRRKDGSLIYVDITVKTVRDPRGELKFIALTCKDVTQARVLSHGRALEARYRGLLETVPDTIVMVNNTGRIVLVNGQA